MRRFDIVVLGGGAAGLHIAKKAALLNLDVCLIEKNKLGGSYLWWNTVPFNVLSEASKMFTELKRAKSLGINTKRDFDFSALIKKIHETNKEIYDSISPEELKRLGIKVLFGSPKFINKKALELKGEKIFARKFVLATGSKPLVPSIEGLEDSKYLLAKDLFTLKKLPKSVCILGAGMSGVELAFALSRFGCQVALLEQNSRILAEFDKHVGFFVSDMLEKQGVKIFTDVLVKRISHSAKRKLIESITDKKKIVIKTDEIFLATGRIPMLDEINLPATGIKFTEGGCIKVGKRCKTSVMNIFACGDVTGMTYADCAVHQADVVLSNILHIPKMVNFKKIPVVLHIDPEIAVLGRTEKDIADKRGFNTVKVEFKEIDASKYKGNKGFLKLILKKSKIIGVILASRNSSELINNYVLMLGKNIKNLKKISFPIPSLSNINNKALDKFKKKDFFNSFYRLIGRI